MIKATAKPNAPIILAQSAVAVSKTGDTNEATLASITIPAGAMGANGSLRLTTVWSAATLRLRKVVGWQTALFAGCSKIGHGRCETPASRRIAFARCGPFAT